MRSRRTTGANGRNDSRNFTFRFIIDCIFGERASPRMERLPSARGPNSILPWTQPMTFSCCNNSTVRSSNAVSSSR